MSAINSFVEQVNALGITYYLQVVSPQTGQFVRLLPSALGWEEQTGELAVRLTATVPDQPTTLGYPQQLVTNGSQVYLYANWGPGPVEIFRGSVELTTYKDTGNPTLDFTAYDAAFALQTSEASYLFNMVVPSTLGALPGQLGLTCGEILDIIAADWSIPINGTDQLITVMPRSMWKSTKLSQMVNQVLDRTFYLGGGVYLVRAKDGQLWVDAPAQNDPIFVLSQESTSNFSDEQDTQDLVTQVVIYGAADQSDGTTPPSDANDVRLPINMTVRGHTEFGLRTAAIDNPNVEAPSGVAQYGAQILAQKGQPRRLQRFEAPDLPFLRRGDAIHLKAGSLNGRYVITGISHDADARKMTITVDTSGDLQSRDLSFITVGGQPFPPPDPAVGSVNPYRRPGQPF